MTPAPKVVLRTNYGTVAVAPEHATVFVNAAKTKSGKLDMRYRKSRAAADLEAKLINAAEEHHERRR